MTCWRLMGRGRLLGEGCFGGANANTMACMMEYLARKLQTGPRIVVFRHDWYEEGSFFSPQKGRCRGITLARS